MALITVGGSNNQMEHLSGNNHPGLHGPPPLEDHKEMEGCPVVAPPAREDRWWVVAIQEEVVTAAPPGLVLPLYRWQEDSTPQVEDSTPQVEDTPVVEPDTIVTITVSHTLDLTPPVTKPWGGSAAILAALVASPAPQGRQRPPPWEEDRATLT